MVTLLLFAFAFAFALGASAPHVDANARSSECLRCHVAQASSFELSGHAQARTSFVFGAALTVDDPRWCVSCHAPRSSFARSANDLEARGIDCVSCHSPTRNVPLSSPQLCAQCHQFGFMQHDVDGRALAPTDTTNARDAQQNTYAEWLAWSSHEPSRSDRTCQSCHMKDGNHTFGGVRRLESLRNAIVVEQRGKRLHISGRDVGHPLPTGDIMRFISVEAARDESFADHDTHVVARFRRDIALQRFAGEPSPRLAVVRDHRIPAEGDGHVVITLPPKMRAWRVIYHLVSEDQEERGVLPADISRIEIMRGNIE